MSPDLPNAHGLAVDWVSRNLFWTSYDTNKKQINVARLDGSFKNAVVQGLEQPHGLVVHPLRGYVLQGPRSRGTGCGAGEEEDSDWPPVLAPLGSSTGRTATTSAWPTWTAATAPCSSVARGALWVRARPAALQPSPLTPPAGDALRLPPYCSSICPSSQLSACSHHPPPQPHTYSEPIPRGEMDPSHSLRLLAPSPGGCWALWP